MIWLKKKWLSFLVLSILVLICYLNSLNNDFISDDIFGIVNNKHLGEFGNLLPQWSAIIRAFLYYLAYKAGGLNPAFFRIVNIFFHVGAVLAFYVLLRLRHSQTLSFVAASIFAVHPIFVESVSWISGGTFSQYTFFFLVSLIFYTLSKNSLKLYFLSLLFFVFSILSSVFALVLSPVFFLYELSFGSIAQNWKRLIPYFILNFIFGALHFMQIGPRVTATTEGFAAGAGPYNPFFNIPVAITSYLQLLIWPDKLTLYHSELQFSSVEFGVRVLIFIVFLIIVAASFKKNKAIFFWLSIFIVSLIPTFTPFRIAWIVAERYVYLGALGIIFTVSYILYKLVKIKKYEGFAYIIFIFILGTLTVRTVFRNIDWKSQDNLWIATARTSPSSPWTHNNMGDVYGRHGNLPAAAAEFKRAIELLPNYPEGYHNLANTYRDMGKKDLALLEYKKAFSLKPTLWQSSQNIAALYFEAGDFQDAAIYMKKAVDILPDDASLHSNLGIIYLKMGKKEEARKELLKALEIDPGYQKARTALGGL